MVATFLMIKIKDYKVVTGKKLTFYDGNIEKGWAYAIIWNRTPNKKVLSVQDVFVKEEYRGLGIGKKLIESIVTFGEMDNAIYKIILECSDTNVEFYEKLGFRLHENHMRLDL